MADSGQEKIIIFGCGIMGHEALKKLGEDNVLCFCDNNKSLHGTTRWGKKIISLEELKDMDDKPVVLVCAGIAKAYIIATQMDEAGIPGYWVYPMVKENIEYCTPDEVVAFLHNKGLMAQMHIKLYKDKISELSNQLDYMKRHVDIRTLKPATGALRQRQLDTVEFGEFVCNALDANFQIRPFLLGGGLIGYVRHNGFIPWDDDLDFGLIREEYERLYQYCLANQDKKGMVQFSYGGRVEELKFIMRHDFCTLILLRYNKEEDMSVSVEFFSYDYYSDDYPFEEYIRDAQTVKINSNSFKNEEEKTNYIRLEIKKNHCIVPKSNSIFFGFDNMESTLIYNKGRMIPENILFPLKKAVFEGKTLWVPNETEEFLSYEFENIWEFPDDVGIPGHIHYTQPI